MTLNDELERRYRSGVKEGLERGRADGIAVGEALKENHIIINMQKNGFSAEQIASVTDRSVDDVNAILAKGETVFA